MIKKVLFSLNLLLVATAIFFSCQKDTKLVIDPEPPGDTAAVVKPVVDKAVNADITGKITDETGTVVNGATVHCGAVTATTDVYGIFRFKNVSTFKKYGFVTVEKSGYFKGSRTFVTHEGSSNYVEIQLIPKKLAGTFTASSGGEVTVNTSKVSFTQNTIVTAAGGAAYTGLVNVYAAYLNPTDANLFAFMPGDLRGVDTVGNEVSLKSFGMMAVELEGAGGEKLQVASGKTATLSMDIPSALSATAPASIPLWYFNDTTGRWMEQGWATKQGNAYLGTVKHFSFWNCDVPQNNVFFKVKFIDSDSNALAYTKVTLNDGSISTYGYTDSVGSVEGVVPGGKALQMQVLNNCNGILYTQAAGPFTSDANLGIIKITPPINSSLVLAGDVTDCSNAAIETGSVFITFNGFYYQTTIKAGKFSITINNCGTNGSASILAIDSSTLKQTLPESFTFSSSSINHPIRICNTPALPDAPAADEYIVYDIYANDGTRHAEFLTDLNVLKATSLDTLLQISAKPLTGQPGTLDYRTFDMSVRTLTKAPANNLNVSEFKWLFPPSTTVIAPGTTMLCNITKYEAVNGYIEGSFSGYTSITNVAYYNNMPTVGIFRLKRKS